MKYRHMLITHIRNCAWKPETVLNTFTTTETWMCNSVTGGQLLAIVR